MEKEEKELAKELLIDRIQAYVQGTVGQNSRTYPSTSSVKEWYRECLLIAKEIIKAMEN